MVFEIINNESGYQRLCFFSDIWIVVPINKHWERCALLWFMRELREPFADCSLVAERFQEAAVWVEALVACLRSQRAGVRAVGQSTDLVVRSRLANTKSEPPICSVAAAGGAWNPLSQQLHRHRLQKQQREEMLHPLLLRWHCPQCVSAGIACKRFEMKLKIICCSAFSFRSKKFVDKPEQLSKSLYTMRAFNRHNARALKIQSAFTKQSFIIKASIQDNQRFHCNRAAFWNHCCLQ